MPRLESDDKRRVDGREAPAGRALLPVSRGASLAQAVLDLQRGYGNAAVASAILARNNGEDQQAQRFFAEGKALFATGDMAGARERFNLALQGAEPSRRATLLFNIGLTHRREGNTRRVEEIAFEIAQLGDSAQAADLMRPEPPAAAQGGGGAASGAQQLFEQGRAAFGAGNYARARELFQQSMDSADASRRATLLFNIALTHHHEGQLEEFAAVVEQLRELGAADLIRDLPGQGATAGPDGGAAALPDQPGQGAADAAARRLFQRGRTAYNHGQFARARRFFQDALEQAGSSRRPALLANIAMTYLREGADAEFDELYAELSELGAGEQLDMLDRVAAAHPTAPEEPEPAAATPAPRARRRRRPGRGAAGAGRAGSSERLAGLTVVPAVNDVNHMIFNRPVTREDAVEFLFGSRLSPAMQVFHPVGPPEAAPAGPRLDTATGGWTVFAIDRTIPAVIAALPLEISDMFSRLGVGEDGAESVLADWIPPDLRSVAVTHDVPFEHGIYVHRYRGVTPPFGDVLAHLQRRGRATHLDAYLELPTDLAVCVDLARGDESMGHRLMEVNQRINRDMEKLVIRRRMTPTDAMAEIRARYVLEMYREVVDAVGTLHQGFGAGTIANRLSEGVAPLLNRVNHPLEEALEDALLIGEGAMERVMRQLDGPLGALEVRLAQFIADMHPQRVVASLTARWHLARWRLFGGRGPAPTIFSNEGRIYADIENLSREEARRFGHADTVPAGIEHADTQAGGLGHADTIPATAVDAPVQFDPARWAEAIEGPPAAIDRELAELVADNSRHNVVPSFTGEWHQGVWARFGGRGPAPQMFRYEGRVYINMENMGREEAGRFLQTYPSGGSAVASDTINAIADPLQAIAGAPREIDFALADAVAAADPHRMIPDSASLHEMRWRSRGGEGDAPMLFSSNGNVYMDMERLPTAQADRYTSHLAEGGGPPIPAVDDIAHADTLAGDAVVTPRFGAARNVRVRALDAAQAQAASDAGFVPALLTHRRDAAQFARDWQRAGGTGPPPLAFMVSDSAGALVQVVFDISGRR
jgi:tetratricopeptide (TPR) repeat protein